MSDEWGTWEWRGKRRRPRLRNWSPARTETALLIAEVAPDQASFMVLWANLGTVVRYLVEHGDPGRD